MTTEPIRTTAVYEDGVLKPQTPLTGLANGDRVEVVLVRAEPLDPEATARRERMLNAFNEYLKRLDELPADPDDEYDVLEAMNETRTNQGERPLIPPTGAR